MGAQNAVYFLPKQMELKRLIENSEFTRIAYGGARGGAKSFAVRELARYYAYAPGLGRKSLIFRRHSKELLNNHINPLLAAHPELRKFYNASQKILYSKTGRELIHFGYAASEQEIHKFQGTEYDYVFIDEATQCSEGMIHFLSTVNRSALTGFTPKMILTMNPGGIGHRFIKLKFVDKEESSQDYKKYTFLPSFVWDNVFWSVNALKQKGLTISDYYSWSEEERRLFCLEYSTYAQTLQELPEDMKLAFLDGNWEVFGGQFFRGFSPVKHVIEPFKVPKEWSLIGSIDPGFSSPCSFGITARDLNGNFYRVATYYESKLGAREHAKNIREFITTGRVTELLQGRKPSIIVAGHDAFAKRDRYAVIASDATFADIFMEHGLYLDKAITDRKAGWWLWKGLLKDRYFIFKGLNKPLVEEMMAVASGDDPEDIEGRGNAPEVSDHALDEQRYGLMSLAQAQLSTEERGQGTEGMF